MGEGTCNGQSGPSSLLLKPLPTDQPQYPHSGELRLQEAIRSLGSDPSQALIVQTPNGQVGESRAQDGVDETKARRRAWDRARSEKDQAWIRSLYSESTAPGKPLASHSEQLPLKGNGMINMSAPNK